MVGYVVFIDGMDEKVGIFYGDDILDILERLEIYFSIFDMV
jgi:hypothetical protein